MGPVSALDALLPVLVAELADDAARRTIQQLATANRVCLVPVIDPPVDASLHVLEIHTPGEGHPLVVLAEPAGAPTERGFPLRLHPYGTTPPRTTAAPSSSAEHLPSVRATRTRPATLTPLHTRDLLGDSIRRAEEGETEAEALVGRNIAAGKLVVEELVGIGGMGAVYRARHKQLDKQVAVKVLHARFRDDLAFCARFHAEALAVSQLDHPNVVRIFDYGQEPDGLLYIAMDFLSGVELQEVLQLHGTLPLGRIVDIALQVSAGLGHAHARGIVHRDVKPSNILLVKGDDDEARTVDVVKVCDFGIAAHAGSSDLIGTPAYMSPEQCAGAQVDGRCDVYALGVILYELATGQLPFNAEDAREVLDMHLDAKPPAPSQIRPVDARLERLILRMLEKDPNARPQSMRELRANLRDLLRPPSLELHDVGVSRTARTSAGAVDTPASPPASARTVSAQIMAVNPQAIAAQLAIEPLSALRESLATPERFAQEARGIAVAMRVLLEKKEIAALSHVLAIFRKVAADPNGGLRAEIAARLVRTLMDPALLAPVAQSALTEQGEAATALLGGLGPAAAHALYAARARAHPTPPLRARFVTAMRVIGAGAWPIVSAALQRNVPGESEHHDPRLAEDLLRSVPAVTDEAVGGVIAKYLRWGEPAVRRAAVPPLVALWGDRARALLLAVLLKDGDEGARVAAINELRHLRGIDEHVVRKVDDVLSDGSISQSAPAGDALKQAVAEALSDASEDARELAKTTLRRALTPKGGVLGMLRTKAPNVAPSVLVALSRSYVALGAHDAVKLVGELAACVDDPLKTQLIGIVGTSARSHGDT
jgi:eukaryotic-like serine/threonine-protein kinase